MQTIILGMLIDTKSMMIIWGIALFIFVIICFATAFSKRVIDDEENFKRNIKIGAARTLGGLLVFFYGWVLLLSAIYTIKKIEEYDKNKKIEENCIQWTKINNKKTCTKYK